MEELENIGMNWRLRENVEGESLNVSFLHIRYLRRISSCCVHVKVDATKEERESSIKIVVEAIYDQDDATRIRHRFVDETMRVDKIVER